jgi:leucyl/phenylalanyl-tRNA--protein transferase
MKPDVQHSQFFPPVEMAGPEGLLALGASLEIPILIDAYTHGIFPWPFGEGEYPLAWWSPDPRAILPLDRIHLPRRLRRTCRSGRFQVTCNRAFREVMLGCGQAENRKGETWITREMVEAYFSLFEAGLAKSVETWREGELAGGVYGVGIGGFFAAESMFYRHRDASKVALAHLLAHLKKRGYSLVDIQMLTPHTERFGGIEIARTEYLDRLQQALSLPVSYGKNLTPWEDDVFR